MKLTQGNRKKNACIRSWLLVDSDGQVQEVEAGKYDIMRRTGVPAGDLRILDPVLAYPSTVRGRERAIVVNLEHIKVIITAHELLLLNSGDPLVTPFVQKLQTAVLQGQTTAFKSPQEATDGGVSDNLEEPQRRQQQQAAENPHGLKLLPFEFVALEACLKAVCSSLDNEARALEQETYPALDKLTSKISTLNLERVRQIKSRLVAITGRVLKVRDQVEHLLDDDKDMAEMYLSHKLEQQELENSSVSSLSELDNELAEEEVVPPNEESRQGPEILLRHEDSTHIIHTKQFDVQELETILDAYFLHIEGTMNKLSTLREYVDDTEDYIKIVLDDKQNKLLQMGVLVSTATFVVSFYLALTGVFGMNINIELFYQDTAEEASVGMVRFLWTVAGVSIGCVVMYVAAIASYKHKKLLQ